MTLTRTHVIVAAAGTSLVMFGKCCPQLTSRGMGLVVREMLPHLLLGPYFASLCMVFFLLSTKQFGQPKVCDLDMLWCLHQYIPGCQVTMHQAPIFQIVHALKHRVPFDEGVNYPEDL